MTDVRILTNALGGSPLSTLIQRGDAPADWVAPLPKSADEWRAIATRRAREQNWSARLDSLAPAFAATGAAAERIDRVRRLGGVVVTTGQQPGLFGGPVYTWSKAVGAIAFADALERETGVPTVAVFWAATDDADFAEASSTVLAQIGGAERVRDENVPPAGTPMSLALLGDLSVQLALLIRASGSVADPRPLEIIRNAYAEPECSVGDAYTRLLREMLAPLGMPVLDASHPTVLKASAATLRRALDSAGEIENAMAVRGAELRAAGFEPQVEDVAGLSLVFLREGTIKRRVSVAEIGTLPGLNGDGAVLTPNVLLRSIVEQHILPTVAYLGGPGEIAYFAQVSAVATAMGLAPPRILPRWSCTLIEPTVDRLLAQFGVAPAALAIPDVLEGQVARTAMGAESAQVLAKVRHEIAMLPAALAPEFAPLGLGAALQGNMNMLQHRVDRFERRLTAAIKRRERDRLRDVATLRAALYPMGTRQERSVNLFPMLSRHGLGLLSEMRDAASAHAVGLIQRTRTSS